jgi:hypothetical protein
MTEEQLSALLRLKRYEKPPPGYFDRLLQDVHRRQRAELLQRPLWQIAVERIRVFFSEHSMGNLTYAGSMAMLLLTGVAAIRLMTGSEGQSAAQSTLAVTQTTPAADRSVKLEVPAPPAPATRTFQVSHSEPSATASRPRYVIDARPVSYEPSRNFAF